MPLFQSQLLHCFRYVIIFVSTILLASQAGAVTQTFTGPWDPFDPANGFSLRATQPGSAATMTWSMDKSSLFIELALNNCYHGCGAFYLDNSTGALPYGQVQFDWTVSMNDYTSDGQIAIDGADSFLNSGARDQVFYPATAGGSANIDYQGGTFTFFNIGIGAEWTGTTTTEIFLTNFSAPDAPIANAGQPNASPTDINEPAGWGLLLLAGTVMYRVRRPRKAAVSHRRAVA